MHPLQSKAPNHLQSLPLPRLLYRNCPQDPDRSLHPSHARSSVAVYPYLSSDSTSSLFNSIDYCTHLATRQRPVGCAERSSPVALEPSTGRLRSAETMLQRRRLMSDASSSSTVEPGSESSPLLPSVPRGSLPIARSADIARSFLPLSSLEPLPEDGLRRPKPRAFPLFRLDARPWWREGPIERSVCPRRQASRARSTCCRSIELRTTSAADERSRERLLAALDPALAAARPAVSDPVNDFASPGERLAAAHPLA
jgi:hypothetical protein